MAQDICRELTAPLVALCVLKGGYQFFTDLLDFIKTYNSNAEKGLQLQVDFIRLKSYVVREKWWTPLNCSLYLPPSLPPLPPSPPPSPLPSPLPSSQDDKSSGSIQVIGGDNLEKLRGKVLVYIAVSRAYVCTMRTL